jgi:hypothetical protein
MIQKKQRRQIESWSKRTDFAGIAIFARPNRKNRIAVLITKNETPTILALRGKQIYARCGLSIAPNEKWLDEGLCVEIITSLNDLESACETPYPLAWVAPWF